MSVQKNTEHLTKTTESTKTVDQKVENTEKVITKTNLEDVKKSIEKEWVKKETTDLLENIKEDQLKDTPGRKEAMESGDPVQMFKAFLSIISTLMSTYLGGGVLDTTGYKKLKKILGDDIEKTIKKLESATPEEIEAEIKKYQEARKGKGTNKQIAYTYFISALQEYKLAKTETEPKTPTDHILDHLQNTVKPWDILVLNKHTKSKKAEFGKCNAENAWWSNSYRLYPCCDGN